MTGDHRSGRLGLLKGILKLVLYGVVFVVALSVVAPQALDDPSLLLDRLQSAQRTSEDGTTVDVDSFDVRGLEHRIHQYVNYRRAEHGLDALSYDTELAAIARAYSKDMAERGFFSHYSPEGEDFSDRYDEAGYDCSITVDNKVYKGGENLARNHLGKPVTVDGGQEVYKTPDELAQAIVTGWMHSPRHRENMLKDVWRNEGIGAHVMDDGTVYVTQNFC